jgi:hypothetical protein
MGKVQLYQALTLTTINAQGTALQETGAVIEGCEFVREILHGVRKHNRIQIPSQAAYAGACD